MFPPVSATFAPILNSKSKNIGSGLFSSLPNTSYSLASKEPNFFFHISNSKACLHYKHNIPNKELQT